MDSLMIRVDTDHVCSQCGATPIDADLIEVSTSDWTPDDTMVVCHDFMACIERQEEDSLSFGDWMLNRA